MKVRGGWVLNDPAPEYQTQLEKCKYFYRAPREYIIAGVSTSGKVYFQLPYTMRANPAPIIVSLGSVAINGTNYPVGSINYISSMGDDGLKGALNPPDGVAWPSGYPATWRSNNIGLDSDL